MRLAQIAEHPRAHQPGPSKTLGAGQSRNLEIRDDLQSSRPPLMAALDARVLYSSRLMARARGNQ
jgi:hypothetical protein